MSEGPATSVPPRSRTRPRVGFLGVGWIGRNRMAAMLETGAIDVAAIADALPDVAAEAGQLAPQARLVATLDDLLAMELDGIAIATPSALHPEQSIRALESGAAVFCQKPLGRTAAEANAAVEAARKADRLLCVDLSYRFTQGMARIRDLVRSGELGHIYAADLVFHNAYGPDKPWFQDPAFSGGGCVMDLGVHLVDLALWVLDFPDVADISSRLFVGGAPMGQRPGQVEDYAVATLELATGPVVRLACSWRLPIGCDAMISAVFHGTEGGAGLHNVEGSFYDFVADRYHGTKREVLSVPPDAWGARAAADWSQRLARGEGFDPAAEQLTIVARVLDRIYGR